MTGAWVVMSVRLPAEIKQRLVDHPRRRDFLTLASLHRAILTNFALSGDEVVNPVSALNTHEPEVRRGNTCPLLDFARTARCGECPYRKALAEDDKKI